MRDEEVSYVAAKMLFLCCENLHMIVPFLLFFFAAAKMHVSLQMANHWEHLPPGDATVQRVERPPVGDRLAGRVHLRTRASHEPDPRAEHQYYLF